MTRKLKLVLAGFTILIIVAVSITGIYIAKNDSKTNTDVSESSSSKVVSTSTKTSNKSKTSKQVTKKEEFSRKGAVLAAQNLLQEVNKSPNPKLSDSDRIKLLNKTQNNYTKVLNKDARDRINLVDFMKTDSRGSVMTAQALINVVVSIKKSGNKNIVAVSSPDYSGIVYFDKKNKIATVPVDLFTTSSTNLGMDFVYTDGKWMFQPYNLISEITIRLTDQENMKNNTKSSSSSSSSSASSSSADKGQTNKNAK